MPDFSVPRLILHNIRKVLLTVCMLWIGLPLAIAADKHGEAITVVEGLHGSLIQVMQHADTLGYDGRYRKLAPVIKASFDLQRLARISTGKYWRGLNQQQKRAFIDVFSRLVIATYAHRFNGYSGEHFRIAAQRELSRGGMLVRSYLVKHDGSQVSLNYILRHDEKKGWRIINVLADGVSDLALKRAEYTSVLATKGKGIASLMTTLESKIRLFE